MKGLYGDVMIDYGNNQGCINGQITKLIDKPEELKQFMSDKTPEQIKLGRRHAKAVMNLRSGHYAGHLEA